MTTATKKSPGACEKPFAGGATRTAAGRCRRDLVHSESRGGQGS